MLLTVLAIAKALFFVVLVLRLLPLEYLLVFELVVLTLALLFEVLLVFARGLLAFSSLGIPFRLRGGHLGLQRLLLRLVLLHELIDCSGHDVDFV